MNTQKVLSAGVAAFAHSTEEIASVLDYYGKRLEDYDVSSLDDFSLWLCDLRRSLSAEDWRTVFSGVIRQHPLFDLIHEEPFTSRAFRKPRGYAGDAPMLDLVYGEGALPEGLSRLGRLLYMWMVRRPAPRSVRFRCNLLAELIDEMAHEVAGPRVLSVACGHLREASRSCALRSGAVSELIAVDQDEESLAEVRRAYGTYPITARKGSVRQLLTDSPDGDFDLVYSAGLYDYLAPKTAVALTCALFNRLRPHGRLLVANFASSHLDIGYMEAIMDWPLVYRDEHAMRELISAIPQHQVESVRTFRDTDGNVVYLDLRRV
jgi:extracellular factor (EF) 3-hydroxypalmitic acid methyl ester biosynthesis protein